MTTLNERYYIRTILRFFDDLRVVPQTLEEVSNYVYGLTGKPCEAQVDRAMSYLESAEYIERCEANVADKPMWKITAKGIRQVTRNIPKEQKDPMIWN